MTRHAALTALIFGILATQAISSRMLRREPYLPSPPPLVDLPLKLEGWQQSREESISPEALAMLGPDDYIVREYQDAQGSSPGRRAELFVAYYKTQLRAKNAHDPKVCLPGSGWNPTESRVAQVFSTKPDGSRSPFAANYYRIRKDDSEQVVLYWFQTPKGVYTQEQQLSAHRVWDSLVDNRTDMALVRITVPVTDGAVAGASSGANRLAAVVYREMLSYFPPTIKSETAP